MPATKSENMELSYQGSVKRVWRSDKNTDRLWFEFSDDYSVFDWGTMPDTIASKGRALTVMGAYFFEQLQKPSLWQALPQSPAFAALDRQWLAEVFGSQMYLRLKAQGAHTHFCRLADAAGRALTLSEAAASGEAVFMEVEHAFVHHPEQARVLGQPVFHYPPSSERMEAHPRLVPLEVVFRFGMPAGSSLKQRLKEDPDYARALGLKAVPMEGEWFDRAAVEFFTKLEPKDRLLSLQEALNMSTLSLSGFQSLVEMSQLMALALLDIFHRHGIELWDGKFEFIVGQRGLSLADSIGPDELRLIYKGVQLSKETIRQVYRGTPWEKSLKEAQNLAAQRGSLEWKKICTEELKCCPPCLPAAFKEQIDHLYPVLANKLVGESVFKGEPGLDEFVQALKETNC